MCARSWKITGFTLLFIVLTFMLARVFFFSPIAKPRTETLDEIAQQSRTVLENMDIAIAMADDGHHLEAAMILMDLAAVQRHISRNSEVSFGDGAALQRMVLVEFRRSELDSKE